MICHIVPPYLTERLPLPDREADLAHDRHVRVQRDLLAREAPQATSGGTVTVYDAKHQQDTSSRSVGTDADSNAIKAGLNAAEALWQTVGVSVMPCVGFEHWGRAYDNAYWDGAQMVFGDGDGRYFGDFAQPIDVCVHERTHGVTGDRLAYQDQAGALNESMSDIAGAVGRQQMLSLTVSDPRAWLIGEGLLLEKGARALRDMLHPGTAYNTPALGKDPQPADMAHYDHTTQDNGGVHTNSSIPSRAFALASIAAADSLAIFAVWADVLLHGQYPTDCTFQQWAQLTVDRGGDHADVIAAAWGVVGVTVTRSSPTPAPVPTPAPTPAPSSFDGDLAAALTRYLRRPLVPGYLRKPAQAWLDAR